MNWISVHLRYDNLFLRMPKLANYDVILVWVTHCENHMLCLCLPYLLQCKLCVVVLHRLENNWNAKFFCKMASNQETINSICLDFNLKNISFVKSELNKLPHVHQVLNFIEKLFNIKFKTLTETSTEKVIRT